MTNNTMSRVERQVMAGVALIYTARVLTSRVALKCYALVFSLIGIAVFASLPHVTQNLLAVSGGGVDDVAIFFLTAVASTTLVVQFALAFGAVAAASLFVELRRVFFPRTSVLTA